ncbi:MAG: GTPase HflX [Planctomycetota bacterium]|nr:MAG: GTPase HflX [Planctomycetota bacterium]
MVSLSLARELTERSAALGRRVGLLVDRRGGVSQVFVGDARRLDWPRLRRVRRGERLRGLRCVSTLLHGEEPSRDDLNQLVRWRLDLLLLLGVGEDGLPTFARRAHLVPAREDGSGATRVGPLLRPEALPRDFPEFVRELERAFDEAAPPAQATGGGQAVPALLAVLTLGDGADAEEDFGELRALARAAGLRVVGELSQRRSRRDPRTLFGKGRVRDLCALALTSGAELVLVNEELAPRQQVALEDLLGVRVLDRTQLILDIFAARARSHAGKLQVEAARLRYQLPRLRGRGEAMTRVGGGKGAGFARTKGAGEKKLEVDRRRVRERIAQIEKGLARLKQQRGLRRARRRKNLLPHVALVGYTNVGKSTLFNRLTDADVLAKDELFASLDPTLRQRVLPGGRRVVFSDSVGFIRRLPDDLVEAFGATLDELADASLLLHVADASDPRSFERVGAVRRLLKELGRGGIPELLVFNKIDRLEDPEAFRPLAESLAGDALLLSARAGDLAPLLQRIETRLEGAAALA